MRELSMNEMEEVNGGIIPIIVLAPAAVGAAVAGAKLGWKVGKLIGKAINASRK